MDYPVLHRRPPPPPPDSPHTFIQSSEWNVSSCIAKNGGGGAANKNKLLQYISTRLFHFNMPWRNTTLEKCIQEIRSWMRQNFLKLNDEKTEFLLFGSRQQLSKVSLPFITIHWCIPYCLFPGRIVTWAWSLAKGQYNGFMTSDWRPRTKILTK